MTSETLEEDFIIIELSLCESVNMRILYRIQKRNRYYYYDNNAMISRDGFLAIFYADGG